VPPQGLQRLVQSEEVSAYDACVDLARGHRPKDPRAIRAADLPERPLELLDLAVAHLRIIDLAPSGRNRWRDCRDDRVGAGAFLSAVPGDQTLATIA